MKDPSQVEGKYIIGLLYIDNNKNGLLKSNQILLLKLSIKIIFQLFSISTTQGIIKNNRRNQKRHTNMNMIFQEQKFLHGITGSH